VCISLWGATQTLRQIAPSVTLNCVQNWSVSAMNETIGYVAVGVYCAPEPMLHAIDRKHDLIEGPLVIRPWPVAADATRKMRRETIDPETGRFAAYDHATFGKQIPHILRFPREPMVRPDGV